MMQVCDLFAFGLEWKPFFFFFSISGTSHLIIFGLKSRNQWGEAGAGWQWKLGLVLVAQPCSFRLIPDVQAQRRSLQIGENESVRSIFLPFLEGEFIFHVLKGVCDHVATKSFFPGITFPFSFLTKHLFGSQDLIGSSLSVRTILCISHFMPKEETWWMRLIMMMDDTVSPPGQWVGQITWACQPADLSLNYGEDEFWTLFCC